MDSIIALGAFGGRLDQTLSNINTLYDAAKLTDTPVYVLGDDSLACLLAPVSRMSKTSFLNFFLEKILKTPIVRSVSSFRSSIGEQRLTKEIIRSRIE